MGKPFEVIPYGPGRAEIRVNHAGAIIVPDDEIPKLISALQDYMSKRAKQIIRDAKGAPRAEDVIREGRDERWVWE